MKINVTFPDHIPARIEPIGESYVLTWTDGLEEWEETYGSLSSALARLALLAACSESGWEDGFADDEGEHVVRWEAFLSDAIA